MGVGVEGRHAGGGPAVLPREQRGDAVGAVRRGELHAEGAAGPRWLAITATPSSSPARGSLVPAPPLVAGLPRGHHPGAVGLGAYGDAAGHPVQGAARGVGGQDDVDGLGPQVHGAVDVGDATGPQQGQQRAEAEVTGDARRVPQGEGERRLTGLGDPAVETLGAADDDGATLGLDHLHLEGFLTRHLDGLGVPGGPPPGAVRAERLDAGAGAPQPLAVEVLVVGHGVGDGPGDRAGVAEVGDAGDARHGEADDVELRAGQTYLLVDTGILDEPVRVAGDHRLPGDRALPRDQPAVAARGAGAVGGEQAHGVRPEAPGDVVAPQLGGEPGEEEVRGQPHRQRGPRLPAAGDGAGAGELRGVEPVQALVDAGDVRPDPVGGLRVVLLQAGEAAAGRVGHPGAPDQHVPGQFRGAEEGGRGALGAVPLHLDLPAAVEGGHQPLDTREFTRVVRPQMGNPQGSRKIAPDTVPSFHFRLGCPK